MKPFWNAAAQSRPPTRSRSSRICSSVAGGNGIGLSSTTRDQPLQEWQHADTVSGIQSGCFGERLWCAEALHDVVGVSQTVGGVPDAEADVHTRCQPGVHEA